MSEFLIYKSSVLRYNNYAVGNSRQVPFVAHCESCFLRNVNLMTSLRGAGKFGVQFYVLVFHQFFAFKSEKDTSKNAKVALRGDFFSEIYRNHERNVV